MFLLIWICLFFVDYKFLHLRLRLEKKLDAKILVSLIGIQLKMKLSFLTFLEEEDIEVKFKRDTSYHILIGLSFLCIWLIQFSGENLVIGASIFLIIIWMPYMRIQEAYKKLRYEMLSSMNTILLEFALNLNAGMVVLNALDVIKEPENKFEMVYFKKVNMIKKGQSLSKVLLPFAQNAYYDYLTRFVRIVIADQKNGSDETFASIKSLMKDLRKERHQDVLKKGEEASTKLLLPMSVALVAIVIALVYPAVLSLTQF